MTPGRFRRSARAVLAVVLAGSLSGAAWLMVMQYGHDKGWTTHEVNAAIGQLMGGEGPQVARRGLQATLAAGMVLTVGYALLTRRAARGGPRDHWAWRGVAAAAVVFLLWGVVLGPLAASRTDVPAGLFGLEGGWETILIGAVAAAAAGITMARVQELVVSDEWWQRKHFDLRESMEELFTEGIDGSGVRRERVEMPDIGDPEDHPPLRH